MSENKEYPLSEQMKSDRGKAARDFLDWLATQNLHLARDVCGESRPYMISDTFIVARFLGIDPDALAAERKGMHERQMREVQALVRNPAKP